MNKTFDSKKFLSQNSIWLVLIALVIIMGIAQPSFFTVPNLLTLLSGEAVKGIMAFGVMFAILSKGIDLTIGASAGLVACITAALVQPADYANAVLPGVGTLPAPVVFLIGLGLGAGIGAIYGAIIAYTKIPAFIATLGGQLICRASAKIFTNRPVSNLSESFRFPGCRFPCHYHRFPDYVCYRGFPAHTDPLRQECIRNRRQRPGCPRSRYQCRKEPDPGLCLVLGMCGNRRYAAGWPRRFR